MSHETKKNTSSQRMWLACIGEVVSKKTIAHRRRGCGWLACRRGSKYEKKTHIVAKDVVGLQLGDNNSLTKIKTY